MRLRRELGVRLVGVLGDASRLGFLDLPNAHTPAVDAFHVWDNYEVFLHEASHPERYWPCWTPQDPRPFCDRGARRDIDVAFVGMQSSGPDRASAIAKLRWQDIDVLAVGGQGENCLPITEVAATHQRARLVVNVARIHDSAWARRGRVFEAMGCGALPVENQNPHTDRWFVPGVHYAPWRDLDELVTTVRHHLQHETQRQLRARDALFALR